MPCRQSSDCTRILFQDLHGTMNTRTSWPRERIVLARITPEEPVTSGATHHTETRVTRVAVRSSLVYYSAYAYLESGVRRMVCPKATR